MGAFGELLIQTWGGDLDKYLGNIPTNRNVAEDETTEEDKERFRYEYKLSTARHRLDILTSNLMYEPKSIENYTEESIKNGFLERIGSGTKFLQIISSAGAAGHSPVNIGIATKIIGHQIIGKCKLKSSSPIYSYYFSCMIPCNSGGMPVSILNICQSYIAK